MMFLKSPRFASNKKTNEKSRVIEIQKKTTDVCPECGQKATCNWVKGVCNTCNSRRRKREKAEQTSSVGRAKKERQ